MNLSGNPVDYIVVFMGGLLLSFTPCIYPLIPITVGYIGADTAGSKFRSLILSVVYVTGIAVTYLALGVAASLGGEIFGRFSTTPIIRLAAGVVILLFGLSMFEWFNWPLFSNKLKKHAVKPKGYVSVFLLGLVSGLIISPCISPVLGAILAYLATKDNVFYGATLLFVFAFGMGAILILAGTFSGFLASLPKSGKWLVYIKKAFAVILVAMGIYFIYTAVTSKLILPWHK